MRTSLRICTALFVTGVILGVIELWFAPWTPDVFIKLELTLGAALVIVYVIDFVRREQREHEQTRNGDKLD